jgi:tRNA-specific 2-thiouridylase
VQLRAHGKTSPATVTVDGASVTAELDLPQRGVAPGQALVMYDGDAVLGSATITRARRAAAI